MQLTTSFTCLWVISIWKVDKFGCWRKAFIITLEVQHKQLKFVRKKKLIHDQSEVMEDVQWYMR
jgi:hypothetical protein